MKKFTIIALILVLSLAFTGCTNSETEIMNALEKSQDIDSMEADMTIKFTLGSEGFSPEDQAAIDQVASLIGNSEITMQMKQKQNADRTAAKAYMGMNMNIGGMIMPMEVWVDTDMSSEAPKLVEIIKMPQLMIAPMFPDNPAMEYIVYDFDELTGEEEGQFNFAELMNLAKEMEPKITEFAKNYVKDFNPEVELIENKGEREVDGEALTIYEIKLDDASFKELLRYTINYSLDSEETVKFMKEYMELVTSMVKIPEEEEQLMQEEIAAEMDNLEEEIPQIKEQFNMFMDSINDIKIIGDNGIVIEYGINKDGYLVYEAGNIDLRLDLEALSNLGAVAVEEPIEQPVEEQVVVEPVKGILNLGISYNSKIKNINGDIEVVMPETNEENSIGFIEFMNLTTTPPTAVEETTDIYIEGQQ